MEAVLTIAVGVALGILVAFAAINWKRWVPSAASASRDFLISPVWRTVLPLLLILATLGLSGVLALYRAEKALIGAESITSAVRFFQQKSRIDYVREYPSDYTGRLHGAAFRRVNTVAALIAIDWQDHGPIDAKHNPLDLIRDSVFFSHYLSRFVGSRNQEHTYAIIEGLRWQIADARLLSENREEARDALFLAALLDLPSLPFALVVLWAALFMRRHQKRAYAT